MKGRVCRDDSKAEEDGKKIRDPLMIVLLGCETLICQEMYVSKLVNQRGRYLGRRGRDPHVQSKDQLVFLLGMDEQTCWPAMLTLEG